jgi:phytoene dehydrogenase-like protein
MVMVNPSPNYTTEMETTEEFDVCVVGAGLSGLVCATNLAKGGARVCVCEKRSRLGGRAFVQQTSVSDTVTDVGRWVISPYHKEVLAKLNSASVAVSEAVRRA